jgi:hypothetical protein
VSSAENPADPSDSADAARAGGRIRPDDVADFRLAQLLLLLTETRDRKPLDVERLSITEFMAANPFLVLQPNDSSRRRLRNAGFNEHSLTYASPGQRFATRRERVMHDLARSVSLGLTRVEVTDGRRTLSITERGASMAEQLTSVYADAYRMSVSTIAPKIASLSDSALRRSLADWLRADPLLFDLLDTARLPDFPARRPS